MNKATIIKISLLGILGTFFTTPTYADDNEDQGKKSNNGRAYIIFDNTAGLNNAAVLSNMSTNYSDVCSKGDVLAKGMCNSFSLGNNDIEVVQNDISGNLVSMIGVENSEATDYENTGQYNQGYLFNDNNALFKLQEYRNAADSMENIHTNLPAGSYGTISFRQLLMNISENITMYGVVRVKIPLIVSKTGGQSSVKLCGESKKSKCTCGPGPNTVFKIGEVICDITLPEYAQIKVNGTLMFDWYDSKTKVALRPQDFPVDSTKISLPINIPLNINPANVDTKTGTMASVNEIQQVTGDNSCTNGNTCNIPVTSSIYFSSVPHESIDTFKYKVYKRSGTSVTLNSAKFDTLSQAEQYHLLFPSGYATGWSKAFKQLNISNSDWQALGFGTSTTSIQTADGIRNKDFEDLPALITNGGLIRIRHHANISGLIYASQALEVSQAGYKSNTSTFIPSLQYFNGAIVVRSGFYFEALKKGGITLISNNPDTYSNTKMSDDNSVRKNFQAYTKTVDKGILSNQESGIEYSSKNGPQWVEIRPM